MRCSDVYVCVIWCCRWEAGSGWGVCGVPASRLQRAPSRLKGKQTQQTPGLSEDRWENSASLWRIRERAAGYAVSSPASRPWNEFPVISWCSLKQEKQLKSTLLALLTYTVCVGNKLDGCYCVEGHVMLCWVVMVTGKYLCVFILFVRYFDNAFS